MCLPIHQRSIPRYKKCCLCSCAQKQREMKPLRPKVALRTSKEWALIAFEAVAALFKGNKAATGMTSGGTSKRRPQRLDGKCERHHEKT